GPWHGSAGCLDGSGLLESGIRMSWCGPACGTWAHDPRRSRTLQCSVSRCGAGSEWQRGRRQGVLLYIHPYKVLASTLSSEHPVAIATIQDGGYAALFV